MVCTACGWFVPKVSFNDPESFIEGNEQCLYLSVFNPPAPVSADGTAMVMKNLPVVFHIHHGQLLYGFKMEIGEVKNVVKRGISVSNANFRLGALGFFAHPDLEQVNVGQEDLILALKWMKTNIRTLGGNPSRVTLSGSSSGASQALLLLASSAATGLFDGAWINSVTMFGSPDFFAKSVDSVFERENINTMKAMGCGTLDCMRVMPYKKMLLTLIEAKSAYVVLTPGIVKGMPKRSFFAYDGKIIPNTLDAACDGSIGKVSVPVVSGHAKDELDNLKFQFPLPTMVRNFITERAESMSLNDPHTLNCLQTEFLHAQGVQETAEDIMFGMGAYLASANSADNHLKSRWHFLITAPASKSKRAWHTAAELLSWSPNLVEDTSQYFHVTKELVIGNAEPELLHYAFNNFIHFIEKGQPMDSSWEHTKPNQPGELGGLPSKIWNQAPLTSPMSFEHHHSNSTIQSLHKLTCNGAPALALNFDCRNRASSWAPREPLEELKLELTTKKYSDLLFVTELVKAMNPLEIMETMKARDQ
eukprot:gnl/MRDRNA2_/MRDRNA2_85705_c0_seq1.p1 gnl/MRDRNA2_/MRDRNA2_85705_c0~~gnl/MRDRNA2_/MRDRNA2_85705_c0_seq1.p1  ORF type:complete len:622 (+),score=69.83 gnl/MRDRNA2_/MRDRNA2_85705_c0_seq1:273-1868(+)